MVLVFGWLTPVGLETETACARSLIFNGPGRSEEHTSELQSQSNLVCRLLLEKKKQKQHMKHDGDCIPFTHQDQPWRDAQHQQHVAIGSTHSNQHPYQLQALLSE